jgi:hypothetical protein
MKAAGASNRRTDPSQYWHVVRGGSEIRCRTSKVRWHRSQAYS